MSHKRVFLTKEDPQQLSSGEFSFVAQGENGNKFNWVESATKPSAIDCRNGCKDHLLSLGFGWKVWAVSASDFCTVVVNTSSSNEPIIIPDFKYLSPLAEQSNVNQGESLTLSVEVQGGVPPYSYAWANADGIVYDGKNDPTLLVTASANYPDHNGNLIKSIVKDSQGLDITSQTIVTMPEPAQLVFTTELPEKTTVDQGAALVFSVAVQGGVPPYSYQWRNDDQIFASETTAILTLTQNATPVTHGGKNIYCKVMDANGGLIESTTLIEVITPPPEEAGV